MTPATATTPVATDSLATPGPASPAGAAGAVPDRDASSGSSTTPRSSPPPTARDRSTRPRVCRPAMTRELGDASDSRVLRYPGSTLTAVLLNLRPGHPEFANPAVRTALLAAIDRPRDRHRCVRHAPPAPRPAPIPPSSFLFDPDCRSAGPVRPGRGADGPRQGRLDQRPDGWRLPKAKSAARRSSCSARTWRPTRPPSGRPRS